LGLSQKTNRRNKLTTTTTTTTTTTKINGEKKASKNLIRWHFFTVYNIENNLVQGIMKPCNRIKHWYLI